ncbi:nucleotidyltransferase domain-containing protein [Chryseobacterium indoltheticum]|uniref:nucleotidyltransferase domain-containing protein n=1 Tax=Chryseobacterium indoltheticum TaxID=254 RepID=UPI001913E179|nr:nucleotidyltransferase [Chryseobacterium indoltheticum]QQQ27718.1 nucleotidyltransferase [Chryseobacterium indoltheticum]
MLIDSKKNQFEDLLKKLSTNLSITRSQHEAAVQSYKAVGKYLSSESSPLSEYEPYIKPQGSFIIGTTIQSIEEDGDIDLDVVCEFKRKKITWTQYHLKNAVGDHLKAHGTYERLLDEEGRRCWTLSYREEGVTNQRYHMDILPAIVANGYSLLLESSFKNLMDEDYEKLQLSITDKEKSNYYMSTFPEEWLQSNPYGYAKWFMKRAFLVGNQFNNLYSLNESVKPTPDYQEERLPLQRVVQLLKRHRDVYFSKEQNDEIRKQKPISCIITTLAARAYRGESNLIDAMWGVINRMRDEIEFRYIPKYGMEIEWISNPVNVLENFADRWNDQNSYRRDNFYRWLDQLSIDLNDAENKTGLQNISESLSASFGRKPVQAAFGQIADHMRDLTNSGNNNIDRNNGLVGLATAGLTSINPIKKHDFYGTNEEE